MAVFDDTLQWEQKLLMYKHRIVWKNSLPTPDKAEGEAIAVTPAEPLRRNWPISWTALPERQAAAPTAAKEYAC